MAASRGPVDPDLYQHIFDPDIEPDKVDDEGIFTAESADDFAAILAMLGEDPGESPPNEPLSDEAAREFARSLGFDTDEED